MIVSLFSHARSAGHDNDSLSKLERGDNRAHACMGYHEAR
jgi:hypothetical protein